MKRRYVVFLALILPMFFACSRSVAVYGYEVLSANVMNNISSELAGQQVPNLPVNPSVVSGKLCIAPDADSFDFNSDSNWVIDIGSKAYVGFLSNTNVFTSITYNYYINGNTSSDPVYVEVDLEHAITIEKVPQGYLVYFIIHIAEGPNEDANAATVDAFIVSQGKNGTKEDKLNGSFFINHLPSN